ncbi:pyridoxal phosphate-dependent transferase [Aspergillus egyptiacus]|nr:pyridoxal phosphate-dependent transferase [Aspergillus egyptiacus]
MSAYSTQSTEPAAPLSQRAHEVAQSGATNLMWDVMSDAWCPATNPHGYVNLGVAENFLMHEELLDFLNTELRLPAKYLTYNDGGHGSTRLRQAIAQFLTRHLHPVVPLDATQIVVTNGVSTAIEQMSWCLADPGEGILLGRPYYGTFIPDISLRPKAKVVPVNFRDCDPLSLDAVKKYEEALLEFQERSGRRVKALMLCHPHNPLGRCYSREVLVELMRLCQKYRIHLISDEIYALSVWENTVDSPDSPPVPFESALSIDLQGIIDPQLVHVLWGMSKDFGANGLRLGAIISQRNPQLHLALKGTTIYSYSSGVSDHLTALVLENQEFTDRYIQRNREKLSSAYAYAAKCMQENGVEYAAGCNAAFFLWLNLGKRYRELHPDEEIGEEIGERVMKCLLQKKVFLATGALFGSEESGWFRIVFSHHRDYLDEGLRRIIAALH